MEIRQIFSIILKWWKLIAVSVFVAVVFSYTASALATPLYRTTTTLMVGRAIQNPNISSGELYVGQQLAYTYIELAKRQSVLEGAIERLGLSLFWGELATRTNAAIVPQTQLIEITVIDNDPVRAKAIADAIAEELVSESPSSSEQESEELAFAQVQIADLKEKIETTQEQLLVLQAELDEAIGARQIQDLQEEIGILESKVTSWQQTYSDLLAYTQGGDINALNIVDEASVPSFPFSPNTSSNVATAALIGLVLAIAGAFLIETLDDSIRTADDIYRELSLPILSYIPQYRGKNKHAIYSRDFPNSVVAEAYRLLRTNLEFEEAEHDIHTLLVTSPQSGEGKTEVAINLAANLANGGKNILLVDADLRSPSIHERLTLDNSFGLSDLIGKSMNGVHPEWEFDDHLTIVPAGQEQLNSAEIISSNDFDVAIEHVRTKDQLVILDGAPLFLAEAQVLSAKVDGVLIVIQPGRTRIETAKNAVEQLERTGANILGVVMNGVPRGASMPQGYFMPEKERTDETGGRGALATGQRLLSGSQKWLEDAVEDLQERLGR